MKQVSDSLMNIILATLENIERYEIKCKQPEHNEIDKTIQRTLRVLILQDRNIFKEQLEHANYLIDEITVAIVKYSKEMVSKI